MGPGWGQGHGVMVPELEGDTHGPTSASLPYSQRKYDAFSVSGSCPGGHLVGRQL